MQTRAWCLIAAVAVASLVARPSRAEQAVAPESADATAGDDQSSEDGAPDEHGDDDGPSEGNEGESEPSDEPSLHTEGGSPEESEEPEAEDSGTEGPPEASVPEPEPPTEPEPEPGTPTDPDPETGPEADPDAAEPQPDDVEVVVVEPDESEDERARQARLAVYREQMEADDRPIPEGMGGVFVPALTDARLEPAVDVFQGSELVATSRIGRKIFLAPGDYLIRVGAGNDRVRPSEEIEVVEGEIHLLVPTWGALVIDVVNERNVPHRGAYDLIRLDTRETVGSRRGADRRAGDRPRTWLLIPGIYKIVRPGGTYRDRVDFTTVQVNSDEVILYSLVIEPRSGEFRGGGIVLDRDPTQAGGLQLRSSIGGAAEFTHRRNVSGADDGVTLGGDVFLDFDMLYDERPHFFNLQLQIEAGATYQGDGEWVKTLDYADFFTIYILQFNRVIGPYISATLNTHMIPGYNRFDNPTVVAFYDAQGNEEEDRRDLEATEVRLGPSFSRTDIRESVGANFRTLRSRYLDLDIRLGFGFQQLITQDLYSYDEDLTETLTEEFEEGADVAAYQAVEPFTHREGVIFSLVASGSLTGWLSYDIEFDILEPITSIEDARNPVIDFDLTLTLRLFSYASLNYILRLRRDVVISDETQLDQALLLRFAFNIF